MAICNNIYNMLEYVTEAIVLDKVDSGELDSRVYLYTKDFGRVSCKVKSTRKITSKLAGHLEPLNLISARIVDKNGPQLIDALTIKNYKKTPELLETLLLVKDLTAESQPDLHLWKLLENNLLNRRMVLKFLGFDPTFAKCNHCQKENPIAFYPPDFYFYCKECAPPGSYLI